MNKADLVTILSKDVGITQQEAGLALDTFVNSVKKALKKGDRVSLVGFGSWEVRKRAARNGVNPQTGEKIKIKARKVVKFNPGKELKELVG